ncbi:unnamed protein product [Prunus armeniaca]|uniref:Uncharacterized protein n=1 Tax=Prunus armeniaca TaxID=36596 RepID=A0A6J5VQW2_PRUAR|nr:unnamed protein product [Prunus armeniaca]
MTSSIKAGGSWTNVRSNQDLGGESLKVIHKLPPEVERVNAADCVSLERFAKLSSILEHKEEQMIKCIALFNCQKLCDNLAHDLSKIENISLNKVSLCFVFLSSKQSQFDIVFLESEVPKWFSHREDLYEMSDEYEFSLEIPRNFKLQNRGLSICVAVGINKILKEMMQSKIGVEISQKEKEEVMQEEEEEGKWQSNYGRCLFIARIYINGESVVVHLFFFEQTYVESPHVLLLYVPFVRLARSIVSEILA